MGWMMWCLSNLVKHSCMHEVRAMISAAFINERVPLEAGLAVLDPRGERRGPEFDLAPHEQVYKVERSPARA